MCDWLFLRHKLQQVIKQEFEIRKVSQPSSSFDIEFAPDAWNTLEPTNVKPGIELASDLSDHPKLGTSIGVQGEKGGGILGGFFQLRCGDNLHRGFLTNYHVVEPSGGAVQSVKNLGNNDGKFYRPDVIHDETKTTVHYFALKDVQNSREFIDDAIVPEEKQIQRITGRQVQLQESGFDLDDRLERRKVISEESMKDAKRKRESLQQMPRTIGRVLISSGQAFNAAQRIVDWAFVEMPATQAGMSIQMHRPGNYAKDLVPYAPGNPLRSLQEFSELEKGQWYFKVGRTTAITAGLCHGTKMILRTLGTGYLTGVRTKYDNTGKRSRLAKPVEFVEEYIILNSRLGMGVEKQQDFCQAGDAGALVIDSRGFVAGLMYANYSSQTGPLNDEGWYVAAGLAMTMPDVQESIGLKTTPLDSSGSPIGSPGELLLA
ncbi:hypothetical protein MMC22_005572 [Lobaria immixta]|nr:hypothetical protein [Lobaria immixta]